MVESKYSFRSEPYTLDASTRASLPCDFVTLSDGITHYEMSGPSIGQPVVLVPGFSVPCYIWDPTFTALSLSGFRVLRYDLYGRGYSDRPEIPYNLNLFDRQLHDLLTTLKIYRAVDLIGLSMGGPIVVTYADRHPEMVRKLGLIDPAGFPLKSSFLSGLVQVQWLGEVLFDLFGDRILVADLSHDFYRPEKFPDYPAKYLPQMQFKGFKRALLSTLRHDTLNDLIETFIRIGRQNRPVLLIWGHNDRTIPFATSDKIKAVIPRLEFHAIDKAGHVPHYERPELVNPILINFLNRD